MPRDKGRTSHKLAERDFPHIVEIVVPLGGLGKTLDAIYGFIRGTIFMRSTGGPDVTRMATTTCAGALGIPGRLSSLRISSVAR